MKSVINQSEIEKRNKTILKLYRNGKTLEKIAKLFKFSRSRAQQIVKAVIRKEIIDEFGLIYLTSEDKKLLEVAVRQEIEEISQKRKESVNQIKEVEEIKRIQEKMDKLLHYSVFRTLTEYAQALDEDVGLIKKYFPQIAKEIINKTKTKWSRLYNKCRSCGTTTIKHQSHGLCENCYFKSDIFKELQESSRLRNQHRWKKKQEEYRKKYLKRPEIIAKRKKEWDIKCFGGNREKTLIRDRYMCQKCGITQEQSLKQYKRDLFVSHLNSKSDNSLSNLITLCRKCFSKKTVKKMHTKNKLKNNKI